MNEYTLHVLKGIANKDITPEQGYFILFPNNSQKSIRSTKTLGNLEKCWYCGEFQYTNKDHFWPKSKGGKLTVRSCYSCNKDKKDLTPLEWVKHIQERIKEKTISRDKGERIINSTLSLWNKVNQKQS